MSRRREMARTWKWGAYSHLIGFEQDIQRTQELSQHEKTNRTSGRRECVYRKGEHPKQKTHLDMGRVEAQGMEWVWWEAAKRGMSNNKWRQIQGHCNADIALQFIFNEKDINLSRFHNSLNQICLSRQNINLKGCYPKPPLFDSSPTNWFASWKHL